jgi:CDP-diacylglycerol--glycerol-3-phosphate 3-phosphatidyltransferase
LELLRYVVDYAKYRRETSYHMWSSKLWGIFLFAGFLSLLGFGHAGVLVTLAIVMGIVADIEGLLISAVLKDWRHDVPTVVHAWRIRQGTGQSIQP